MALAGAIGMIFGSLPGKQKLPIYCGYGLLAFVLLSDIVQVAFLGSGIGLSMLFPFVLHGFYLWGAMKNKKELEAVA